MDEINKIEQAIEALESKRHVMGDEVVDASLAALKSKLTELHAAKSAALLQQRKVATILFCDIVGHTQMIQDLDPEDNMAIIDSALVILAEVVESFGGHIARYQGDGFKAIFGLPTANESDPENAVLAGLRLIERAQEYAQKLKADWNLTGFNVRVGIDTGLVVAGGVTEAEDTIKGMAVNLAARLESAAPPGGLLISHRTYQNIRGIFDVEPQEPILAKGFPEPVPVYLVKRAKPRAFRMGKRGVEGLETKTVGRDKELQILHEAYKTAIGSQLTTVITLVGEAGVGKSRLAYEFKNWLDLQPETIWYFKGRASQQTQGIPQYLLRDMLADRFQILDSDPLSIVHEKFGAGIREFMPDEREMKAHILGAWLGYDFSHSPHLRPIQDEPEQIKNRATLYLAQLFSAISEQSPAVVLLDDIHWADSGTLDIIKDLAIRRPRLPLLVVCLTRPALFEWEPEWGERLPIHIRLDMAPLSGEETRSLVGEILRLVDPLPQVLLNLISSRAEGNPFFAEEPVKMLIDDGVILTGSEKWQVIPEQLLGLKVPDTLTGVLQARLDKLQPQDRQAVQQAAVISRIFWDKALEALENEGLKALPVLQAKEFIFPRGESAFAGMAEYIFKHALLRDVIYATVLKRVRGRYHALVAEWLVTTAEVNGRGEEYAAVIGEHYQLADDPKRAAYWYGRAGQIAASIHAHAEAVRYLSLALDLLPEDDHANRFALLEAREKAYHIVGNRDAQSEDLVQLVTLAESLGEIAQARATLGQAQYSFVTSDYSQAIIHAQATIERAQHEGEGNLAAEAHWVWGSALFRLGQYPAARDQLKIGLDKAKGVAASKIIANCLNVLGILAYEEMDYSAANVYHEQALSIRREISNRLGEAGSLNNLGLIANDERDYTAAKAYYEQSLAIWQEIGGRLGEGEILNNLGFITWEQGDFVAARGYYERALAIFQEIGDWRGEGVSLSNLGLVATDEGNYATAREYYEQSLAVSREVGDRWGEGISLINFGEVALALTDLTLAEACYQEALGIHQELSRTQYLVEDWAGLAKLKLAQDDKESARSYAKHVLNYLKGNSRLQGAENPVRAFRFTWEVFSALDQTIAADETLGYAIQVMQEYLDKNSEPTLQEMYLRQPHHALLWAAWTER